MIIPVLMHIPMKFYYRKYMLKKKLQLVPTQVKWAEGEIANFSCSPGYVMFGPRTRFFYSK